MGIPTDNSGRELVTNAVYQIVRMIPPGRATSYGAIARAAGIPRSARLVGRIIGSCDSASTGIPAHRVVNSQGVLSGRDAFASPGRMRELLEEEGVTVENNRIRNWRLVFWDPLKEINI